MRDSRRHNRITLKGRRRHNTSCSRSIDQLAENTKLYLLRVIIIITSLFVSTVVRKLPPKIPSHSYRVLAQSMFFPQFSKLTSASSSRPTHIAFAAYWQPLCQTDGPPFASHAQYVSSPCPFPLLNLNYNILHLGQFSISCISWKRYSCEQLYENKWCGIVFPPLAVPLHLHRKWLTLREKYFNIVLSEIFQNLTGRFIVLC